MKMTLKRYIFDWVMVLFFASHIPITILVDSQALFPTEWYPQAAVDMSQWYLKTYKDPLVRASCV